MKGLLGIAAVSALFACIGCGGSDSTGKDLSAFVGSWQFAAGTSTVSCAGQPANTQQLTGTISIQKGIDSDLVQVSDDCTLKFDVSGSSATARSNQSCTSTDSGVTTKIDFTAFTFTVSGKTARLSGSANLTLNGNGQTVSCTGTQSGDLTKVSS